MTKYKLIPDVHMDFPRIEMPDPDTIVWGGDTFKKVADTTIPFMTTDVQREFIHDIKVEMELAGLNQDFIDTACSLAERDQGIYDLLHQYWHTPSNDLINGRKGIIIDLEASLKDYGYPHKAHDTNPEKPEEEHSYWSDKGACRKDIGDCCYVVRQEIADAKNVMQFEYWCDDGGGWINSKETATLYSRKEASKLARELRNPPSDGRVHIAKRVKKDSAKQDPYVICKPPSGMIQVYQYWDKNRGVLTSDEDYATEYSNPLDADSALAVLSLTRGKDFKGCEVVKRTKIVKTRDYIITREKLGGDRETLTNFGWSKKAHHVPERFTFENAEKTANDIRNALGIKDLGWADLIRVEKGNQ